MSPVTTNTSYPGSNIGNQSGLWNWLKNLGSSGSQFSINPTITNEQIGNSVQQIQNFGLPTAVTPSVISPYGINSIIREGEIDKVVSQAAPDALMDFSNINKSGITWGDMYGSGTEGGTDEFNVVNRKKRVNTKNDENKDKPDLTEREKQEIEYEFWKKKAEDLEGIGKRGAMAQWQKKMWGNTIPKLIAEGGYKAGEIGGNTGANLIAASQSIRPANVMTQFTYQPRGSVDFARLLVGL